mgnify:CR=1 FL=1
MIFHQTIFDSMSKNSVQNYLLQAILIEKAIQSSTDSLLLTFINRQKNPALVLNQGIIMKNYLLIMMSCLFFIALPVTAKDKDLNKRKPRKGVYLSDIAIKEITEVLSHYNTEQKIELIEHLQDVAAVEFEDSDNDEEGEESYQELYEFVRLIPVSLSIGRSKIPVAESSLLQNFHAKSRNQDTAVDPQTVVEMFTPHRPS